MVNFTKRSGGGQAQPPKPSAQADATTAIVPYGDWTPEAMDEEGKEMATGGDFWKVPVGSSLVRFLPPKIGWKSPFVIQHQHFIDVPGLPNAVIFCCPKMHAGKPCVADAKADELERSDNARDQRAAKRLRPNKRVMANVIIDPKNVDARVMIWAFGKTVYDQLRGIREDDEGGGNFLDPMRGFNIAVKRVGTGKDDTKYTLIPSRNFTQLANMDWIDTQSDLRRLIRIPTVDQQKRLLNGDDPRDVWGDGPADDRGGEASRGHKHGTSAQDDAFDGEVDIDD